MQKITGLENVSIIYCTERRGGHRIVIADSKYHVVLETPVHPASLTPAEAREIARLLIESADRVDAVSSSETP